MDFKRLESVHCGNDMKFQFQIIVAYFPMKKNTAKAYTEADPKKRMGILSRHAMSVAVRCGISSLFLETYMHEKRNYIYVKEIYKKDREKINNLSLSAEDGLDKIKILSSMIGDEVRYNDSRHRLRKLTSDLLHAITESRTFKTQVQLLNKQ